MNTRPHHGVRTTIAPPEEDPNVEVREYASPACYAHELDTAWQGPIERDELLGLLQELLAGERAGARVMSLYAKELPASERELGAALHEQAAGERRCVRLLCAALRRLGTVPEGAPGAFLDKARAVHATEARLQLLVRAQAWVVRRIRPVVARVDDGEVRAALAEILSVHEQGVAHCEALLAARHP